MKNTSLKKNICADLADKLQELRRAKGLNLQETAILTNLSVSIIYDMECGKNRALNLYVRLLKFYGKELKFSLEDIK